mmetsp:Transcript_26996/g.62102  ORF Transcript_26996/g.62102 Transcript_26996/m.62102 type:complete len:367 (-) Transcript_26996:200-1300(-)|eukprot:CAMPEP_0113299618 /NCGR_PEP_ID=MMETSP0010_2-20120614/1580_1 /TAXON_ID=216773 ORGANISM="Corethron hystrix, Strain 308" /NCGR_SAMPLE_ID=MMETSP0010_2 /ASSEMBLY_ACC=CAM_ASM_000155 /LENGTH=366 /DNA_ID=CAMNT_0000152887 /DNA_START=126 /DNA_END=1226 /DNA_ORIENTATION=+ /assembly_acc=CAM_ASM_000155
MRLNTSRPCTLDVINDENITGSFISETIDGRASQSSPTKVRSSLGNFSGSEHGNSCFPNPTQDMFSEFTAKLDLNETTTTNGCASRNDDDFGEKCNDYVLPISGVSGCHEVCDGETIGDFALEPQLSSYTVEEPHMNVRYIEDCSSGTTCTGYDQRLSQRRKKRDNLFLHAHGTSSISSLGSYARVLKMKRESSVPKRVFASHQQIVKKDPQQQEQQVKSSRGIFGCLVDLFVAPPTSLSDSADRYDPAIDILCDLHEADLRRKMISWDDSVMHVTGRSLRNRNLRRVKSSIAEYSILTNSVIMEGGESEANGADDFRSNFNSELTRSFLSSDYEFSVLSEGREDHSDEEKTAIPTISYCSLCSWV